MKVATPDLPELLAVAFEAGGIAAVIGLSKAFGGKRVFIPKGARDDHPILIAAGDKGGRAVVQRFGGEQVQFPKGKRALTRLTVEAMKDAPANEIADALNVSYRHVGRLKAQQAKHGAMGTAAPKSRRVVDSRQIDMDDLLKR